MARRRMIVWPGLSELDHETPVVVVATYDTRKGHESTNVKTGDMVQVYILREDIHPQEVLKLGLDGAICGTCPHRSIAAGGTGACYVQVWRAPAGIWKAIQRDSKRVNSKTGKPTTVGDSIPYDLDAFKGRLVRFGAYGDPAAVPTHVWRDIAKVAKGWTGYTHQWQSAPLMFRRWLMASCDSPEETELAQRKGYRTFEVRPKGSPKPPGVITCPASTEAGKRTTCSACLQCGGTDSGRSKSITIMAHGATASRFGSLPLSVTTK